MAARLLLALAAALSTISAALAKPNATAAGPTLTISVVDLGGDPTGRVDSSAALRAAFDLAVSYGQGAPAVVGAGNVLIDLAGGTYLLDSPLLFTTSAVSGIMLAGGTLVANPSTFSAAPYNGSAFLLDFTFASQLTLKDLTLDASHAGGCLRVDAVLQSVVTNVFFLHFSTFGLLGDALAGSGHELLVSSCVFAEFEWGEDGYDDTARQSGVAIEMQSYGAPVWNGFYDSNFIDIIIRCTRLGVANRAGANLYYGVHVYATCVKTTGEGNVTAGFLSEAGQTRVANGYFDDSPFVALSASELVLSDSLFYGHSALIVAPQQAGTEGAAGLFIRGNIFSNTDYAQPWVAYDTRNGSLAPGTWEAVAVADNKFGNETLGRRTRGTAAAAVGNVTLGACAATTGECVGYATVSVDLRGSLLFLDDPAAAPYPAPGQPFFDWQAALGPEVLARIVTPNAWSPNNTTSGDAGLFPLPVPVPLGAPRPSSSPRERGRDKASVGGPTATPQPRPISLSGAFGGVLASVSASAVTTFTSCGVGQGGGGPGPGAFATAALSVAAGAALGVIDVSVRVSVVCAPGTGGGEWGGLVSLLYDQSGG
jgi:hypothetical protein